MRFGFNERIWLKNWNVGMKQKEKRRKKPKKAKKELKNERKNN